MFAGNDWKNLKHVFVKVIFVYIITYTSTGLYNNKKF